MTVVLILLTATVAAGAAAVATGLIGGGLPPADSTLPPVGLPDTGITASDITQLRLSPALRGYRMDQVDEVLGRLAQEIDRRDLEIAALQGQPVALTGDDIAHVQSVDESGAESSLAWVWNDAEGSAVVDEPPHPLRDDGDRPGGDDHFRGNA